jgi:hypothetical protein
MQRHSKKRPVLQGPALLAELHALEKRLSRVGAFIPFLGPWLIRWSDVKTTQERKQLRRRCYIAADVALSLLLIAARPHSVPPEARAEADIRVLGGIIEEFRARNGTYPDQAAWGRTLDLGDRRYIDPWGRPYVYIVRNGRAMIGTYGRDAQEGGVGDDADVWQTFGPEEVSS